MDRRAAFIGACICLLGCTPLGDDTDANAGGADGGGDVVAEDNDAGVGDGCTKQPPAAYATLVNGTIAGSDVSASFCGASAYLYVSPFTTPKNDVLLILDSIYGTVRVDAPSNTVETILSGMMQVGATNPGVYTSAGSCGFLSFTYWLPPPTDVDCEDASGPNCPSGCSTVCSSQGCLPCEPIDPEVNYGAAGVSDCLSDQTATTGSWTITLTSVTPYDGQHYLVHGTMTATLPGGDGGAVNVTAFF